MALSFKQPPAARNQTNKIIIHHVASAGDISAAEIHRQHLGLGWLGIGYHYVVRYDGNVERGRPENTIGAHAQGHNSDSIGICLSGNIDKQLPTRAQLDGVIKLVQDILKRYPGLQVLRHKDVNATACPGKLFPWEEFRQAIVKSKPAPVVNIQETKIIFDNLGSKTELEAVIYQGKTYVEARKLFEIKGYEVNYDPLTKITEVSRKK